MRAAEKSKKRLLPVQWEELTASDFPRAVERAAGVCVLPIGVIEFHGLHLPLGTDMIAAREASISAARREYAVVFPPYYFGQVSEAKHRPGTVAVRPGFLMPVLQSTCDEIARNGFQKILIVNGHGGDTHWLHFFCQSQLATRKDYVVYVALEFYGPETEARMRAMYKTDYGGHGDEAETSWMMAIRPDLVQLARAGDESGRARDRLKHLEKDVFTGIWWYARFPNHYAGDARPANVALGEVALDGWSDNLARVIREVKQDTATARLQKEFYRRVEDGKARPGRNERRRGKRSGKEPMA